MTGTSTPKVPLDVKRRSISRHIDISSNELSIKKTLKLLSGDFYESRLSIFYGLITLLVHCKSVKSMYDVEQCTILQ